MPAAELASKYLALLDLTILTRAQNTALEVRPDQASLFEMHKYWQVMRWLWTADNSEFAVRHTGI